MDSSNEPLGNIVLKYKIKVSKEAKFFYLDRLVPRIFKVMPIIDEQGYDIAEIYLWSLLNDLSSANDLFDGILIEIITKMHSIYSNKLLYTEVRRVVFDCIDITKKLRKTIEKEVDDDEQRS